MIRYQIFENDVTTAGGIVQPHTGGGKSFIWHNRLASNIGDKIKCPACGSVGYIEATGMRRPFDNHKDIPALDGDLCICKCNPPPVLKHSQTSFRHNVAGGIIINNVINPLTFNIPNTQQNLNNNLVDDKDQDESYYKWHWGASAYKNLKTNEQQNKSFLRNFNDLHNEYAFSTKKITYEIDPKAWDTEVAFEDLLPIIQASADNPKYTLGHTLSTLKKGQSADVIWTGLGVGGDYLRIGRTKHWPHGRIVLTIYGTVTKLGIDANGKNDFQFKGHARIGNDIYSWTVDYEGYKNALINAMGAVVATLKGTKQPAAVYNTGDPNTSGLPTSYTRYYHFDYYKKGVTPPKYEQ
jgi:hypothetical protein